MECYNIFENIKKSYGNMLKSRIKKEGRGRKKKKDPDDEIEEHKVGS